MPAFPSSFPLAEQALLPSRELAARALELSRSLRPSATFAERFCAVQGVAPDREFIAAIGALRRLAEFPGGVRDHSRHSGNRGWIRRVLRVRVSVGEVRRVFIAAQT